MGGALGAALPFNGIAFDGGAGGSLTAEINDSIDVTYRLKVVLARPATATDTIGVSPVLTALRGVVLLEHLAINHSQVTNAKFQLSVQDIAKLTSRLYPGLPVLVGDGIGINPVQQAQLAIKVIERLGLGPVLAPMMLYNRSLTESVRVADALVRFIGAEVADNVDFFDFTDEITGKGVQLSDGIGIAPALNPTMVWKAVASDTIDLDSLDIPAMLYSGELADGIELSAAYLVPGSITTWAMNTKTAAVTEYTNYAFNSFAKLGHKYLGASDDGLYELVGDDDNGTDIVAQLRSGFAQWAGTRMAGFKGVYLGVRGSGGYVLKLITGDDKTYTYAVSAKDMATTKVTLGKGLRARYFAFELTSTGQDFDLDTIEFVPLVSGRRV